MSTLERIGTIREAINEALHEEMQRDPTVILMGEDVGLAGGVFKVTDGLLKAFGPERVFDTPIAEAGIVGLAVGAAMTGLRPIAEIMFCDFTTLASDQIVKSSCETALHDCGPDQGADGSANRDTARGSTRGRAAQPEFASLVLPYPGTQSRNAFNACRCQGPVDKRHP